ncbi:MAG: 30S ribosomal protein S17 [Herpetosiphonaceae bacterium]|nr:30S ribosomal protein S17 [Herpetosiphonaceae bacterium]
MTNNPAPERKVNHKQKVGRVVSAKMDKTVVVAVDYLKPHPIYRKTVRSTSKFYAHDENNSVKLGDMVRIEETRPLSKLKRWKVVEVIGSKLPPVVGELPNEVIAPGRTADGAAETGGAS